MEWPIYVREKSPPQRNYHASYPTGDDRIYDIETQIPITQLRRQAGGRAVYAIKYYRRYVLRENST